MMVWGPLNLLLFCEVRRAGGYDSVLHPLTQVLLTSVAAIGWRPVYIPATTSPSTIQSTSDSSSVLTTILSISTYNPAAVTELFYADIEEEEMDYNTAYYSTIPDDAPAPHLTTTTYRPVEKIPKPAEEVAGAPGYLDDTVDTTISPPFTLNLEITTTRITSSETATTTARILPAPRQRNTFHSPTLTFQPTVGGVTMFARTSSSLPSSQPGRSRAATSPRSRATRSTTSTRPASAPTPSEPGRLVPLDRNSSRENIQDVSSPQPPTGVSTSLATHPY